MKIKWFRKPYIYNVAWPPSLPKCEKSERNLCISQIDTSVIQTSIFGFQMHPILIHPLECVLSTYCMQGTVAGMEND